MYFVALFSDGEKITCDPFDQSHPVDEESEMDTSAAKMEGDKHIATIENNSTNE